MSKAPTRQGSGPANPGPKPGMQTNDNIEKAQEAVDKIRKDELDQTDLAKNINKLAPIVAHFEEALLYAVTNQKSGCVRMMVPFKDGKPKDYTKHLDFPTIDKINIPDEA